MSRAALQKSETTDSQWKSWSELYIDYKKSLKEVNKYRDSIKSKKNKNTEDKVNLEISASMKSDLYEMTKEMEQRILYELNAYNDEDFNKLNLTERQKEVLMLRSKSNSYRNIGKKLGLNPDTVFEIYKSAIKKVIKYSKIDSKEFLFKLSPQQVKIYVMKREGKTKREIAKELGISINSVKTQLKRVRNILKGGVTKYPDKRLREKSVYF